MNKKSKFATFLLSFIPGLGHLYLGYANRGFIFMGLFFGVTCVMLGLSVISGTSDFLVVLPFAILAIWFISLVDAIYHSDIPENTGSLQGGEEKEIYGNRAYRADANRTLIAAALSLIPGAGHMYLGYLKYGAEIMVTFFMAIFLMGWLNMPFFLFVLPVIWFYSLFDAIHRAEGETQPEKVEDSLISLINKNPRLTGLVLIFLGCFAILDQVVFPLVDWRIRHYFQTGLVSLILISSGVKLIWGSRTKPIEKKEEGGNEVQCGNGE